MKHTLLIFGLLILISWNSKKIIKNEVINPTENIDSLTIEKQQRYIDFKNKLPKHRLPIDFHCGFDSLVKLADYKDYLDFIPKDMEKIYGFLSAKGTTDLILYGIVGDDLYPYIYSYDNYGNIIDSLFLIITPCGQADEFSIPNSYAFIDENGMITMIDTSLYVHYLDNLNYEIDSTIVTTIKMKTNINGEFQEISREKN